MAFIQGALLQRSSNRFHLKLYLLMITVAHEPYVSYSTYQEQEIIYKIKNLKFDITAYLSWLRAPSDLIC